VRVQELWRYPVKSLQGERLHQALVTAHGLDGDRRYAIFDVGTGLGLTARRMPQLLFASASLTVGGSVRITLPDGSAADGDEGDDALSDWLGRRVALRSAGQASGRRYEDVVDSEREQTSPWRAFEGASGPSTTPAGRAYRWSRHRRSAGGTAAGFVPTCCSTAQERTR